MMRDYLRNKSMLIHGALTPGCSFWAGISLERDSGHAREQPVSSNVIFQKPCKSAPFPKK